MAGRRTRLSVLLADKSALEWATRDTRARAAFLTLRRRLDQAELGRGGAPLARGAVPQVTRVGVVPRQLPAGAAFFAGREAELKQLDELLGQAGPPAGHSGRSGRPPLLARNPSLPEVTQILERSGRPGGSASGEGAAAALAV